MKKTIMIDMDDVICASDFVEVMESYLGRKVEIEDGQGFYLQDMMTDEEKEDFFKNFDEVNLYKNTLPYEGCVEAIKKLSDNYEVYICTDFIWREAVWAAGTNAKNKYDYLLKYFPFIDPKHFIFGGVKSIINCDIKIDDYPINLENAETKILFSAYHNINMTDEELKEKGMIRANSWNEILEILK